MRSHTHEYLMSKIASLSVIPEDIDEFEQWLSADKHLQFLRKNAGQDELIIYASGHSIFVHAVVIPNENINHNVDFKDLLQWSSNPYSHQASYAWGFDTDDVWIERGISCAGAQALENGHLLVYGRTFEGWHDNERNYFELDQEYTHVTDIHWRAEHGGYCRFDKNGDIENVVSISAKEDQNQTTLISFLRRPLEKYLAASNSTLVQLFDFTMYSPDKFSGWSNTKEEEIIVNDDFFYRKKIDGLAAYCRGVQIVRPARPRTEIFSAIRNLDDRFDEKRYESFLAHDWRNDRIVDISTNPTATTNYFQTENNSLPFELSPAFFRPEVLAKYNADSDKYTVSERYVSCRATWSLSYDVNEANQVHAYLCDLRHLPYSEQIYWKSFNEIPRAGISKRALEIDFLNRRTNHVNPIQNIHSVIHSWDSYEFPWWKLRDDVLLQKVSTPYTNSRDEWARAFMDLSNLIIEGFDIGYIRALLQERCISYRNSDKSLTLIEKFLRCRPGYNVDFRIEGLRSAQMIRNKVGAHATGSEAKSLAEKSLKEHGSFTEHFNHVCKKIFYELQSIEHGFKQVAIPDMYSQ